ncbi:inositol-phosphate phosphatase [Wenzhouxiangella sp. C33]|uniref:Nus factor SuhB n=2 Tax=Wenzhouxiangella limi TaxID=2707351 RepID=A0A845VGX8_9GAMM|nr:inositol-phosphate phosphatase [Wenzhouxiangella limi]
MVDLERALSVARQAAARADGIAMSYFQTANLAVERKSDASPVTVADRHCEEAIRETLRQAFPEHAVFGEEYGHEGESRCLWLVDPIDGTRSFIRGLPFWSVQIGLMIDGELMLGVSSAPAFGETAWALSGGAAFVNDRPARVREVARIEEADLSFGNLRSLAGGEGWGVAGQLVARAARSRGYGDFYSYHRLADGGQDAVIESDVNILDIAALTVICREAGARVTDLKGRSIDLATTSILAAGPNLHDQLLSLFHDA